MQACAGVGSGEGWGVGSGEGWRVGSGEGWGRVGDEGGGGMFQRQLARTVDQLWTSIVLLEHPAVFLGLQTTLFG